MLRPVSDVLDSREAGPAALRGSALDPFGYTEERRQERALMADYRAAMEEVLRQLTADKHALALEIARLPEQIKGFGHVKARNLALARRQWAELLGRWRGASTESAPL